MATKIFMPALSPTMTEGFLTKWLVNVGDKVKAGDMIFFTSGMEHRVTPVTKGVRYSLVNWFVGPPIR